MITHTIERVTCPLEVVATLPPPIALPDDAVLAFTPDAGDWLSARFRREELLAARLSDAVRQCPAAVTPQP